MYCHFGSHVSFKGCSTQSCQDCLPLLRAAVLEAVTKNCELTDCVEKAAVQVYTQEALQNSTNAYLAFVSEQDTPLYSQKEFVDRVELFTETLEQVAQANAGLTDYYVSRCCTASGSV